MIIRAVVEFEITDEYLEDTTYKYDISEDLRCLIEHEHYGLAKYKSCTVESCIEVL